MICYVIILSHYIYTYGKLRNAYEKIPWRTPVNAVEICHQNLVILSSFNSKENLAFYSHYILKKPRFASHIHSDLHVAQELTRRISMKFRMAQLTFWQKIACSRD